MKTEAAAGIGASIVGLAACFSVGAFGGSPPSLMAPLSLTILFPVNKGVKIPVTILLQVAAYAVWSLQLFNGKGAMPKRTLWLIAVILAGSVYWYASSWNYGIKWQGYGYTVGCAVMSAALGLCCAFLAWTARTSAGPIRSVSAHTLLFVWIATYAFAYMGELG